jgi:hypothetical protein
MHSVHRAFLLAEEILEILGSDSISFAKPPAPQPQQAPVLPDIAYLLDEVYYIGES